MTFLTPDFMRGMLWVAYILYVGCFIPQIYTNYKRRSTSGISNVTIFLYFFGYLVEVPYAFFLNLPLSCKIMLPFGALVAFILALQRVYYERSRLSKRRALTWYGGTVFTVLAIAGIGIEYPFYIGHMCGWMGSTVWLIYQVPQVIKVFARKSVEGFNPLLILIGVSAALIEIAAALIIPLPVQALFNGIRGLVLAIIFTFQFLLYRKRG